MYIEHVAAEPNGLIQHCGRCNLIVQDYRNAMIEGKDRSPAWWAIGKVFNSGNWWSISVPNDEEIQECQQK